MNHHPIISITIQTVDILEILRGCLQFFFVPSRLQRPLISVSGTILPTG